MQIHFEITAENGRGLADSIWIVRLFTNLQEKTLPDHSILSLQQLLFLRKVRNLYCILLVVSSGHSVLLQRCACSYCIY